MTLIFLSLLLEFYTLNSTDVFSEEKNTGMY